MELKDYKKVFQHIVDEINNNLQNDIPYDISEEYYIFRKNFFNYIGVSQYSELCKYSQQVLKYIEDTYPYCFKSVVNTSVDEAIWQYVLSVGGTQEQFDHIIDMLKNIKITNIDKLQVRKMLDNFEMDVVEQDINIGKTIGTSVKKYQYGNLYDVLKSINDKNFNSYISYLVINNVFNDETKFKKVFMGLSVVIDQDNNVYVNEGNHRIFTYVAILRIRDYLGLNTPSETYTVDAVAYKSVNLDEKQNRRNIKI